MNNLKLINYRIPFAEYEDVRTLSCGYGFTVFSTHGSKDRVFGCGFNSDGQIGYHERVKGRPLGKDIYLPSSGTSGNSTNLQPLNSIY